ncbi:hypothetical protein DACRYDRAFT_106252 [Dacryopinax primogenitus]|uniref:Uncharacterized protein n=1 Tax=Dacryopinax primogenitus (strain DJM 731) TaxID=1858805 RepID=M5GAS5_DACPD|nr:uncharacterized protein DACRYDRAFT_106252 [Dacryopinax primogenitus]EJU03077.1 hypothetical protein DACRYDRAFT_106252 [Dacryopinax primogenitus]
MTTPKADIVISIKPEHMADIVARTKDHEFRKYVMPSTVKRWWFYVSSPDKTLRYVAVMSRAKGAGELTTDGLGNTAFNAGEMEGHYAYEVEQLYKLTNPWSSAQLQQTFGISPPRKYVFVKTKLREACPLDEQTRVF